VNTQMQLISFIILSFFVFRIFCFFEGGGGWLLKELLLRGGELMCLTCLFKTNLRVRDYFFTFIREIVFLRAILRVVEVFSGKGFKPFNRLPLDTPLNPSISFLGLGKFIPT
jgi:hypothetical protein